MSERTDADKLAERLLSEPNADPDDDLRMLARQLLRRREVVRRMDVELAGRCDGVLDLVHANRDAILHIYEEGVRRIGRLMFCNDAVRLVLISKVLHAINTFHPMHAESWIGWPEGS